MTTQGERLQELAKAARFSTLAEFARAAGIEPGTARQHANRGSVPADAAARYVRAARSTGASVEWLLFGTGEAPKLGAPALILPPPSITAEVAANDTGLESKVDYPQTQVSYPPITPGRPDVPLWASAAAGDDGAMILVPDPIDYLRRSERMLNVRNPFAFNVIGASMSPAIEHGDQVVINPSVVARPMHDCVFISEGPDGMFALVKRLLRSRPDHWQVRQFNPPKDFDISRKKWARVHPIAEIRKAGV